MPLKSAFCFSAFSPKPIHLVASPNSSESRTFSSPQLDSFDYFRSTLDGRLDGGKLLVPVSRMSVDVYSKRQGDQRFTMMTFTASAAR